uniref:Cytochrome b5 heme-binding domain-containing protein n=1 Tax=Ditylum brightwellii TaxID=49249 RepID=A0A7S4RE60_9STRA
MASRNIQRFVTLTCIILALISTQVSFAFGAEVVCDEKSGECAAEKKRVVTQEELSSKTGENGSPTWLSVLGEVYDVTPGSGHYGSGSSYSIFAGKDSTASFVTGDFSEEGGKASLDDLPTNQLGGIESWRKFYANHAKYTFVGVLEGMCFSLLCVCLYVSFYLSCIFGQ